MGEILNEAFEAVLQSMPARMEAVIKARGGRSTTEPEGGPRTVFFTCNDSLGHGDTIICFKSFYIACGLRNRAVREGCS